MSQSRISLELRTRTNIFKNTDEFSVFYQERLIDVKNIAILSIGMWSVHKCKKATERLDSISIKANVLMKKIREYGGKVIHGSSTLVNRSEYAQMRKNIFGLSEVKLTDHGFVSYPPIPIDDSDGGISEPNKEYDRDKVLMNKHIELDLEKDAISGHNKEILNYLHHHNIKLLLVCGTHTNMCLLDRTYGIKNLIRFGFPVVVMRDLVDVVHNPKMYPYTSREETNELMAEWIEKYFCPTVLSDEILFIPDKKKIVYADIDDTICHGEGKDKYENPLPLIANIDKINRLYDKGHIVIYWTARGSGSGKDWSAITKQQLDKWNVKRHLLRFKKPNYDVFICDKTINLTNSLDIDNI